MSKPIFHTAVLASTLVLGSQLSAVPTPSKPTSNQESRITNQESLTALFPDTLTPGWQKILASIQSHSAVESHFEENRHFPFHRDPVALHGIMRWQKDLGLSLDYPEQSETLVVNATGIRRRHNEDSFHSLPDDPRLRAQLDLFLPLLSFDFKALAKSCDLSGSLDDRDIWTLKLIPKTTAAPAAFLDITTTGEGEKLQTITIRRDERVRIVITLQRTIFLDLGFTTAEKKRHWGAP